MTTCGVCGRPVVKNGERFGTHPAHSPREVARVRRVVDAAAWVIVPAMLRVIDLLEEAEAR